MSTANPLGDMIRAACLDAIQEAMTASTSRSKRLYSPEEAAIYLALSRREIYNMIANGELHVVPHGRRRMLDVIDLDAWIAARKK